MVRGAVALMLGALYSVVPLYAGETEPSARKGEYISVKEIGRNPSWKGELSEILGKETDIGAAEGEGDRFMYPVRREGSDVERFIFLNGAALGNFSSDSRIRVQKKDVLLGRNYSPSETLATFCLEEGSDVTCGYGILVETTDFEKQTSGKTLVTGDMRSDGPYLLLSGRVVGVRKISGNSEKYGFVVENFFKDSRATWRGLDVLVIDDNGRVRQAEGGASEGLKVGTLSRDRIEQIPGDIPFYLERTRAGWKIEGQSDGKGVAIKELVSLYHSGFNFDDYPEMRLEAGPDGELKTSGCLPCERAKTFVGELSGGGATFGCETNSIVQIITTNSADGSSSFSIGPCESEAE